MNTRIKRYIAEHDGSDPLNDEDYAIIKGMVIGTGKIDLIELGYLLTKNLVPFVENISRLGQVRKRSRTVYEVDLTQFTNEEDFISHVKNLVHNRVPRAQPSYKRVNYYNIGWKIVGITIGLIVFLSLLFAYLRSIPALGGFFPEAMSVIVGLIVGIIGLGFVLPQTSEFFDRQVRKMEEDYVKIVNYLESHENFATIRELASTVKVSRKRIIKAITSFGKGLMRQIWYTEIERYCKTIKVQESVLDKFPPEETFYFFPQVDGVIRLPQTQRPLQLEQATAETIWGMFLLEKKIDFALAAKGLHLAKHHILRMLYKILASTPMKFKFSGTSVDLLEEQDVDVFLIALKDETEIWFAEGN